MTNAIEQAKREMYERLSSLKSFVSHNALGRNIVSDLENGLESYLELLRQDHEALHETARKRFEDLQKAEANTEELSRALALSNSTIVKCAGASLSEIRDLESKLAKMTEERDSIQLRLHAVDHAYSEQQSKLHPCMVEEKGLQDDWDAEFKCDSGKPRKCLNGACKARKEAIVTMARENGDRASCANLDGKTAAILGAVVDARQIVSDWAIYGYKAKKQMKKLAYALNNNPELSSAMIQFEKPDSGYAVWFMNNTCQHSFFAIGDEPAKCTYCCEVEK